MFVCTDADVCRSRTVSLNYVLQWFFLHIKILIVRNMNMCIFIFSRNILLGTIGLMKYYYYASFTGLSLFVYMCLFGSIFIRAYFIIGLLALKLACK
jgi:hypothetical protein